MDTLEPPGGAPAAPERAAELADRVRGGEGRRLELKRGLPSRAKVARTLGAFANGVGGLFVVGVQDDLVVCGAPRPDDTAAEVASIARRELRPPLAPRVWIEELATAGGPRRVVVAWVPRSEHLPHLARQSDGQWECCERRAASTRQCEPEAVRAARDAEPALDAVEAEVLAAVRERPDGAGWDGASSDGATLETLASATGHGRARVRRALHRLESSGRLFGWGAGDARRFVV